MTSLNKKQENLIKKLIAGEITSSETEELQTAARQNNEIRELLQLHQDLKALPQSIPLAEELEFINMRKRVLNEARISSKRSFHFEMAFLDRFFGFLRRPLVAYALALFMFFGGYFVSHQQQPESIVHDISLTAKKTSDFTSSINSPYIFSNARIETSKDDRLKISFDVARHLDLDLSKNDPLVSEILAQSLVNSQKVGQRMRNIDESTHFMDPKIKQALIITMLNDDNVAVRQKSLMNLIRYPNDPDIQDALVKVLKNEKSVNMRLAAIEYLGNHDVNTEQITRDLGAGFDNPNLNSAVIQKINNLKKEESKGGK